MHLLDVEDVTVRFGGVQAVDGVSLGVDAGEIVGVIGPNGAGKTTLLNVISGLVHPQSGRVLLEGRDLASQPSHRRALLGLARTLQGVDLYAGLTVRENLLLAARLSQEQPRRGPLPAPAPDRVDAAAEFVGIAGDLGRQVAELPGGRQRLVDIAAAICLRPRCLLLDEPAAGSGPAESVHLGRLLMRVREALDLAVLIVEHDVQLVLDVADYIYVLDFGRLIAEGTPRQIRRDPRVIAAYLGDEASGEPDATLTGVAAEAVEAGRAPR